MFEECNYSIDDLFMHTLKENIPLSVQFELTYRCNLACSHCYVVNRGEKELSFNEITDVLDQLAEANCFFLTLTGGDVFMRDDTLNIVRYARSKGFVTKIFTNGNLITENVAHELGKLLP